MNRHHIVIEGISEEDEGLFNANFVVTCVETGQRFFLHEPGTGARIWDYEPVDFQARYFMNGSDGGQRCKTSTNHVLLGAVKR